MPANPPRNHHYLPEFYTKRWACQNGRLIRYMLVAKGKIDQKKVSPGGVGFQRDLYTFPFYDEDSAQGLELGLFSYIDNYAAGALEQFAQGEIPQMNERRTAFAQFVFSLQRRSPHAIEAEMDDVRTRMSAKFDMLPKYDPGVRLVALMRLFSVRDESDLGRALINMEWGLIEAPSGTSFLTGDNPVLLYGGPPIPTCYPWIPTSDLESFGIPISPSKLVIGYWPGRGLTGLQKMSPRLAVRTFNKYIVEGAKAIVIAADESHSAFIRKHFGARA